MQAIIFDNAGGPEVLTLRQVPDPDPSPEQVLVRVRATALNRADTLQRQGQYPPPVGESDILGLELAGEIERVGSSVTGLTVGERIFGLVGGGAYAEKAVIDARMALPIPTSWTFAQAAAVPEVYFTAQETMLTLGQLTADETILIHAGASGVGTAAIQMAREIGAKVLVTAGSDQKVRRCIELGATAGCNYKEQNFSEWIKDMTKGTGVDVIEDFVGAAYWERNLDSLRVGGRLVIVGLLGGVKVHANLGLILRKRLQIMGSVLRSRTLQEKIAISQKFKEDWLPLLETGKIRPIIDKTFPLDGADEAHRYMEMNKNFGKIVLEMPA